MRTPVASVTKKDMIAWMALELDMPYADDVYWDSAGECDLTLLAENCADHFGRLEWLDDDLHEVWEAAVEVMESAE